MGYDLSSKLFYEKIFKIYLNINDRLIILNTLMQIRAQSVENCGLYVIDWIDFSRHVPRKHEKELEIFVKLIKSDPKQPFMSTFTVSLVIAKRKQTQLEKNHG